SPPNRRLAIILPSLPTHSPVLDELRDEVRATLRSLKRDRVVVTGVHLPFVDNAPSLGGRAPLALGMVMAHARRTLGDDPAFDLPPRFATSLADIDRITAEPGRHVLLYSDYVWSYDANVAASRQIKSARPDVINVHGGANIPSYAEGCEHFFQRHPDVDF